MTEYKDMLEHMPAVVFRLTHKDNQWKTVYVTENISMFGYTREDFVSGNYTWFSLVHPDDRVLLSKTISDYEEHGIDEFKLSFRLLTKNGDAIPVNEYNTINRDDDNEISSYDTVIVKEGSFSFANDKVINNHYKQQIVLNDILMSIQDSDLDHAVQIILDRTGEYLDTSRALLFKDNEDHTTCKVVYEWDNKGITSVMDLDYVITYETGMPEIYVALQTTGNLLVNFGEIPENCKEEFEAEGLISSAIFAVYLKGEHYGFVCFDDCVVERKWDEDTVRFLKNISNLLSTAIARQHANEELRASRETIEKMAYTDALTQLANRHSSDIQIQKAIDAAKVAKKSGYVIFIDLDDFKVINDCYGHDYGDEVLISFANWLKMTFASPHQVFRIGGDEFIVILDYNTEIDIEEAVQVLHERAKSAWKAKDKEFYCTLSVGIVRFPNEDADSKMVVKQADIAMYEAKRKGKNQYVIYEDNLDTSSLERSQKEILIREAMDNNFEGFEIFYQPILNKKIARIEGVEALLRIKKDGQIIEPSEFLPLAEYLGLMIPIGNHVITTAFSLGKQINDNIDDEFKMCINLANKQLQQKDVITQLEGIIKKTGINRNNIMISVSESIVMEDEERAKQVCRELEKLGITVVLDDFGGGTASVLQLSTLPVSQVTTSPKLISDINDAFTKEFITLITKLCHSVDKELCINGIETEEQYNYCMSEDCDKLQGYYLYKVLNQESLMEMLLANNRED